MSNRTRWPESDIEPERHISRYQRRKLQLEHEQEAARLRAELAQAKKPTIDLKKLKAKLASKPTEKAEREGGPLPSDFHWAHYPDED